MKKSPTAYFIIVCGFFLILLFCTPHILHIARVNLPDQCHDLSAAAISVVITACVTGLLLHCQSNSDEQREKNAKVYEQKLNVCLDFFKELSQIVEDGKITAEEANHLKFTFSYVAIHLSEKSMVTISEHLSTIAQNCGQPASLQGKKPLNLSQELLAIAHTIRCEIYPNDAAAQQNIQKIVDNLNKLDEQVENKIKLQALNCENSDENYIKLLGEIKEQFKQANPSCDADLAAGPSICITQKGTHYHASIHMGNDKQREHFFQCQVKMHSNITNVQNIYAHLHQSLGGRVGSDSGWWSEIPKDKAPIKENLASTQGYKDIKDYAVTTLQNIVNHLQKISEFNHIQNSLQSCELNEDWAWQPIRYNQALLSYKNGKITCVYTIVDDEHFSDFKLIRKSAADIDWTGMYKDETADEVVLQTTLKRNCLCEELKKLNSHFQVKEIADKIQHAANAARDWIRKSPISGWFKK